MAGALSAQVVQFLIIAAACVPYLKPFLMSLESGLYRNDDLRRHGLEGLYGYSAAKSKEGTPQHTIKSDSHETTRTGPVHGTYPSNSPDTAIAMGEVDNHRTWEAESQTSHSNFIKVTTTLSQNVV